MQSSIVTILLLFQICILLPTICFAIEKETHITTVNSKNMQAIPIKDPMGVYVSAIQNSSSSQFGINFNQTLGLYTKDGKIYYLKNSIFLRDVQKRTDTVRWTTP